MEIKAFKINFKLALFAFFAFCSLFFSVSPLVLAQSTDSKTPQQRCDEFYQGFQIDGNSNAVEGLPRYCSIIQLSETIINKIILPLTGSALVLFIIIGGFLLITAGGNEEQAEKGKKVMTNAVIGMVVVIMAFAIVRIVANTLTSNLGSGSSNTTNSNNTSNTSGTQSNGTNNSSGNNDTSIRNSQANLQTRVTIPATVRQDGVLEVWLDFPRTVQGRNVTYEADIKNICGGINEIGNNVSITAVDEDGNLLGEEVFFTKNTTSLIATLKIPASELTSGQRVVVQICDVSVQVGRVTLTQ